MSDTNEYSRRHGPRDRGLRAADSDRDAVAEILRREHLAGRLDDAEFEDRTARCLRAKTYADLDELIADFPSAERRERRPTRVSWRPFPFVPFVPLLIVAVIFSQGHLLWLVFPLAFFLVLRPMLWGRRPRAGYRRGWAGR